MSATSVQVKHKNTRTKKTKT